MIYSTDWMFVFKYFKNYYLILDKFAEYLFERIDGWIDRKSFSYLQCIHHIAGTIGQTHKS